MAANGQQGWVAEIDGVVSGFLVVRILPPEMEFMNVVVAAELRGKGLAGELIFAAENEARVKNVTRALLEVRESNAAAISLYERYGFSKMGFRPGYYQNPSEAAILMEKEISP